MRNVFNDLQNKVTLTNLIDSFQIEKRILLVFVERQNSSKQGRASSQDDLVGLNLDKKCYVRIREIFKQWPLAPNSPKWRITRVNVSRRVTKSLKKPFGECERMY